MTTTLMLIMFVLVISSSPFSFDGCIIHDKKKFVNENLIKKLKNLLLLSITADIAGI